MTESEIEPAAAKRRLVGGLVHDHEQEGDEVTLHDHERQRPGDTIGGGHQPDQGADQRDGAIMAERANDALKIRSRRQFAERRRIQRLLSRCGDRRAHGRYRLLQFCSSAAISAVMNARSTGLLTGFPARWPWIEGIGCSSADFALISRPISSSLSRTSK